MAGILDFLMDPRLQGGGDPRMGRMPGRMPQEPPPMDLLMDPRLNGQGNPGGGIMGPPQPPPQPQQPPSGLMPQELSAQSMMPPGMNNSPPMGPPPGGNAGAAGGMGGLADMFDSNNPMTANLPFNSLIGFGMGMLSGNDRASGWGNALQGMMAGRAADNQTQKDRLRKAAFDQARRPDGTTDYKMVAWALGKAGDSEGAAAMARVAAADEQHRETARHNRATETHQAGTLDIARRASERKEVPEKLQILAAAGIDPKSEAGQKALFPRTDTPISATDKKALFAAEDEIPAVKGTIETLQRAKELNPKTYTGYTAGWRGALGAKLPSAVVPAGTAAAAEATNEWQLLMESEAIKNMSATLKGATTDREMAQFTKMLGDPSTPPMVRERIIDRLIKLAERELEIKMARVNDLRGGGYFKKGYDPTKTEKKGGWTDLGGGVEIRQVGN